MAQKRGVQIANLGILRTDLLAGTLVLESLLSAGQSTLQPDSLQSLDSQQKLPPG
jgi:hypothetical protein